MYSTVHYIAPLLETVVGHVMGYHNLPDSCRNIYLDFDISDCAHGLKILTYISRQLRTIGDICARMPKSRSHENRRP
jgi:hypothetical protein